MSPGVQCVVASRKQAGFTTAAIDLAAGETAAWAAVLRPGDLQIRGRVRVPAGRATDLVVLRQAQGVGSGPPQPIGPDGWFTFDLPIMAADRPSTIGVYEAGELSTSRAPLAVATGVLPGTASLELVVAAESLPAGTYWLVTPDAVERVGPYVLRPGQTLDLGTSYVPTPAYAQLRHLPKTTRRLTFDLPADRIFRGGIAVDVFDDFDRRLRRLWVESSRSGWNIDIELPLGCYRVRASANADLAADAMIAITDLTPSPYSIPVPLRPIDGAESKGSHGSLAGPLPQRR